MSIHPASSLSGKNGVALGIVALGIVIGTVAPLSASEAPSAVDILAALRASDHVAFRDFKLTADVEQVQLPHIEAKGLQCVSKCTITERGGAWGLHEQLMSVTGSSTADLVPLNVERYDLLDVPFCGTWQGYARVGAGGGSEDGPPPLPQGPGTVLLHDCAHSAIWFYKFRRLMWAAGRGYSDYIDKLTSCSVNDDGTFEVIATGSCVLNSGWDGTWKLIVDPSSGYLIRFASFDITTGIFRITAKNTGRRDWGDVCLPEKGEVHVNGSREIEAVFVGYTNRADEVLLSAIRTRLRGTFPAGTHVTKYIDPPGVSPPLTWIVGQEED